MGFRLPAVWRLVSIPRLVIRSTVGACLHSVIVPKSMPGIFRNDVADFVSNLLF